MGDDKFAWPPGWHVLRDLDNDLQCAICAGHFTNAASLSDCGHVFCSLCVRLSLDSKEVCPTCRKSSDTGKLRARPELSVAADIWRGARPSLAKLASDMGTGGGAKSANVVCPCCTRASFAVGQSSASSSGSAGSSNPLLVAMQEHVRKCVLAQGEARAQALRQRAASAGVQPLSRAAFQAYHRWNGKKAKDEGAKLGLSLAGTKDDIAWRHKRYVQELLAGELA